MTKMPRKTKCAGIWNILDKIKCILTKSRHCIIILIKKCRGFVMEKKEFWKNLLYGINPVNVFIGVLVVLNSAFLFFYKTQQLQPQIDQLKQEVQSCQTRTTKLELDLSTNTAELKTYLLSIQSDLQIIKMEITTNGLRHNYSVNR